MSKCSVLGIIQEIMPVDRGTSRNGNQWTRQTIVVKEVTNSQYERIVAMDLFNDNIAKINPSIGMMGEFRFEANSRYNESNDGKPGRWFTSLTCFDYKPFQTQQPQAQPMQQTMQQPGAQPMAQSPWPEQQQQQQYGYQQPPQGGWQPQSQMDNNLPFGK